MGAYELTDAHRAVALSVRRGNPAVRILTDLADSPGDLSPKALAALADAVAEIVGTLPRPTPEQVEAAGRILRRAELKAGQQALGTRNGAP
jgi:hypothetical protein